MTPSGNLAWFDDYHRGMPRSARFWWAVILFSQALWLLPAGAYRAYRWLAVDEPETSRSCAGSSRFGQRPSDGDSVSTCHTGETVNMIVTLVFLTVGIVLLVVGAGLIATWVKRNRRDRHLRSNGVRAQTVVTQVTPTNIRVNGRTKYRLTVRSTDPPGLEFQHSTLDPVSPGTALTVLYDPAQPSESMIVDDVAAASSTTTLTDSADLAPPAPPT